MDSANENGNKKNNNTWLKTFVLAGGLIATLVTIFVFVVQAETGKTEERVEALKQRTAKVEVALDGKVSTKRFDDMFKRIESMEIDIKKILQRLPEK